MAMMDDLSFLIPHIRNSFITSDDTGICEMVIQPEIDTRRKADRRTSGPLRRSQRSVPVNLQETDIDQHGDNFSTSGDILPDMDFGAHRLRSNTALRLERMKKEKKVQSKIKIVSWRKDHEFNAEELGYLFEKKKVLTTNCKTRSRLTEQLKETSAIPDNPFMEFAKFDGRGTSGTGVKKINIFLTMVPEEDRAYPLSIITLATARVQDLIGLICWQYTNERRTPVLYSNLQYYSLNIAEDDGEVDLDFPNLDNKEPISKFGFNNLALVEKIVPPSSPKNAILVTVNIPDKGFSKIQVENDAVPMKEILAKVLHKRKVRDIGLQYNLERQNEPGTPVDLAAPLSAMNSLEFYLVRENSSRGMFKEFDEWPPNTMADTLISHQYKSYRVVLNTKLWTRDVQLGVSGEKVEIDPVSTKGAAKWFRQKAVTYDADAIGACDVTDDKTTGKATFRLVYLSRPHTHDYKHHDFEAETLTVKEIVQKVNNILELRSSLVRKEYLAMKERKMQKKSPSTF